MQQSMLARVVERLAIADEKAGFTVEDMIQMLNAGVTVETLLDLIDRGLQAAPRETGRSYRWIM